MTMPSDIIMLLPVFAAGTGLGAIFFGSLWWTISRLLLGSLSAPWLIGSAVVRIGLTLAGFLIVAGDQWQRWLAVLAGFIAVRIGISRLLPTQITEPSGVVSPGSNRRET